MKALISIIFLLVIASAVYIPTYSQEPEPEKKEKEEFFTLRQVGKIVEEWESIGDLPLPIESPVALIIKRRNPRNNEEKAQVVIFIVSPDAILINSVHFLNVEANILKSYYWNREFSAFVKYYYPEAFKRTSCGSCHRVPTKKIADPEPEKKHKKKKPPPPLIKGKFVVCQSPH